MRERESCTIIIRKNIHDKCDIKEVRGGSGNDCAYIRHMFNVITSSTPKSKSLNENWCLSMSCTATRVCFVTENHTIVGNQQVSLYDEECWR